MGTRTSLLNESDPTTRHFTIATRNMPIELADKFKAKMKSQKLNLSTALEAAFREWCDPESSVKIFERKPFSEINPALIKELIKCMKDRGLNPTTVVSLAIRDFLRMQNFMKPIPGEKRAIKTGKLAKKPNRKKPIIG